ncbi:dihydrolipoyl dehydrogenase [Mycoplasma testudineum]|uniref:dihydrolipoyl dehydrogenase n=1 Tax=Mycoplasma testudineum TaxID=244584 RepID=UPI003C7AE33E
MVVGAGPAGYLAAEEAGKYGLKTLIVEKEFWGGVCLNIGCIPTKALLNSTHYLQATQEAQEVGVVYKNANIEIDYKKSWKAIQAKKDAVVKQIVGGVKLLLKQPNIKVIEGTAEFVAAKAIKVDGKVYSAKNVILATGSVSRKLNLPGFDKAYEKGIAITSRSAINMQDYPSSLNIIGAGVIGLEMAQVYSTAGVKVNVIQNTDSILTDGISLAIRKALITRLEKDGVKFYFNSQVKEMKGKKLLFESNGEAKELEADYTLVSVGRVTVSLGVDKFGIKFDERGVIQVDDNFETNIAGFYAVGDVNAQKMLAHVAYSQAQEVVNRINGISHVYPKKNVPAVIYTNPEISFVGLTHKEAVDAGYKVVIGKYSYAHLGRAIATGKNEGFIEIYVDSETGKILGSQIFGANISDFIAEITLAMDNEITIYEIASTIHPHPSYAEIIWEAARGVVLKLHKSHK